jgi:hypothetical protein
MEVKRKGVKFSDLNIKFGNGNRNG